MMQQQEVAHAIIALKKGGIGVMPTDTMYGLVASALNVNAVKRVYDVRRRDVHKPLIILIATMHDLAQFGIVLSASQKRALADIWRARQKRKTSVILICGTRLLSKWAYLHRGTGMLALRLVHNKNLVHIIKKTGPLVAPSANPQGRPPAQTIREARRYFGDGADFYISARHRLNVPASRIIRLNSDGSIQVVRK